MTTASSVVPYLNSQLKLHCVKEIFPDPSLLPAGKLQFFFIQSHETVFLFFTELARSYASIFSVIINDYCLHH